MITGQFVKGIFNGSTESYQTKNVEKMLPIEEFDKLWNLERLGVFIYVNPECGVVAKTTVTQTSDGQFTGRKGVINHTVIAKFASAIAYEGAAYKLDPASVTQQLAEATQILAAPFPTKLKQPLPEPSLAQPQPAPSAESPQTSTPEPQLTLEPAQPQEPKPQEELQQVNTPQPELAPAEAPPTNDA